MYWRRADARLDDSQCGAYTSSRDERTCDEVSPNQEYLWALGCALARSCDRDLGRKQHSARVGAQRLRRSGNVAVNDCRFPATRTLVEALVGRNRAATLCKAWQPRFCESSGERFAPLRESKDCRKGVRPGAHRGGT